MLGIAFCVVCVAVYVGCIIYAVFFDRPQGP